MKKSDLNKDFLQNVFSYRDGELFWKIRPNRRIALGSSAGNFVKTPVGYRCHIGLFGVRMLRSRLVFIYHHDYIPNEVDHSDRNTMNDRIENLREADRCQNASNRSKISNSTSIYLGVFICKSRFIASLNSRHKNFYIGAFKIESEADLAYNRFAVKHHGEFANLNIIKP